MRINLSLVDRAERKVLQDFSIEADKAGEVCFVLKGYSDERFNFASKDPWIKSVVHSSKTLDYVQHLVDHHESDLAAIKTIIVSWLEQEQLPILKELFEKNGLVSIYDSISVFFTQDIRVRGKLYDLNKDGKIILP